MEKQSLLFIESLETDQKGPYLDQELDHFIWVTGIPKASGRGDTLAHRVITEMAPELTLLLNR